MSDATTAVWIDPARRCGEPCIGGTRIPVSMVIATVWNRGLDVVFECWPNLTRQQVLNACWYAGSGNVVRLHGKGGRYVAYRGPWRKRWGAWAEQVHEGLWSSDVDDLDDPPRAGDSA